MGSEMAWFRAAITHLQKTQPELAPLGRTSARSEDESPSQQTKTNESGRSAGAKAGLKAKTVCQQIINAVVFVHVRLNDLNRPISLLRR